MALNLIGSCQTAPGASLDKLLSHTSQEVIKREIIMRASGISALGGTVLNLEARAAKHCPLAVNSRIPTCDEGSQKDVMAPRLSLQEADTSGWNNTLLSGSTGPQGPQQRSSLGWPSLL